MNENQPLGLGVIGMGGFGLFATQHFLQVPNTRLVAIAGTFREAAQQAARRFGAQLLDSPEDLVRLPDVDVVYLATPPFLHYQQALLALRHGKHVICEKPLAISAEQGREMIAEAQQRGRILVTNLMQRYNPLIEQIGELIGRKLLGDVLHGYFENYASDEGLAPEHWFWDRRKSGGIFIEHGVHFFDLFEGWLGKGEVVSAQVIKRPGYEDLEDQVQATVQYSNGVLVNFYHGFTQPGRIDRQEMRILFERGDVTLHEWVPTRMTLRGIVNEEETRALLELFPGARLDVSASYGGADRRQRGRFKDVDAFQQIQLSYGSDTHKQHLYGDLLRGMFKEQTDFIRGLSTKRRITEQNGYRSLLTATDADRIARKEQVVSVEV
ncbi:MAG: Gfo/Idh/MocA family oxidoreductase [Cytophagaceae bacterium]|nr:Gfo/Idh/MocA family oxidoreductase [Cytophagaceae bacterium]